MWKRSLSTKIFLSFTLLTLLEVVALAYVFSSIILRDTETYLFEALSNRTQLEASHYLQLTAKNIPPVESANKLKLDLIDSSGNFLVSNRNSSKEFNAMEILPLLPERGTVVTPCKSLQNIPHYCSMSVVSAEPRLWIFDASLQASVWQIFWSNGKEILFFALILIVLGLALTYLFSRVLLRPLKQFARAAGQVSEGTYTDVTLPKGRSDEVGGLAKAFEKMIRDLREREHSLAASAVKLAHSARLASIGQMGAGIAHEVKNPITSMMGYARILAKQATDPSMKESAEIIVKESERCNQILQQMLRFARNDPQEKKPYAIQEVLNSTMLLAKAEADLRGVKLNLEKTTDGIAIGSAQQVQQVLLNLILNAIQASSENSTVDIRSYDDGNFAVVEIEDRGKGIPLALQGKIFDPFFTTKPKGEGTGLGLSVALEIIQNQEGQLQFESEEGRGTKFTIRLPLAERSAAAHAS